MMNLNEVLILTAKNTSIEGKFLTNKGLNVEHVWKNDHFSSRKFSILKSFNLQYLLYGFTKNQIFKYNKIILTETSKPSYIIRDIKKWNPDVNICFYLWNIVQEHHKEEIESIQKMGVPIFTFEKDDCKKYNLNYNPQLYPYLYNKPQNINEEYDCYFCAADKNRTQTLIKIKKALEKNNVSYKFRILLKKHKKYNFDKNDVKGITFMEKSIPYEQLINEAFKSKAILEIVQEGQNGFTWRVFESIFYDKKLITNNKSLKDYDFYHPNNIFILDNNYDKIKEFLAKPFIKIDNEIKEKYDYKNWICRFFDN